MDMIERVARAMCVDRDADDTAGGAHPSGIWLEKGLPWWTGHTETARTVLQAIREPSAGMVEAGGSAKYQARRDGVDRRTPAVWQAMIDAALGGG